MKTIKLTVEKEIEVLLPPLPKALRTQNKDVTICLGSLSSRQLNELTEAWSEAVRNKARDLRYAETRRINNKFKKAGIGGI
jgi:hypothetical protein